MSFTPGTRFGPYEIQALVGAGGMGEVYRARDTRLDRTVAVKVLAGLTSDSPRTAELRERFHREALAVSRLNHPHICTLHDVGRDGDVDFLVMEYVEGETLDARLTRGPLPLAQAVRASVEIADALARAHAAGIVHRDLKPANIMLTRTGVKLLDFGIAKVLAIDDGPLAATRTRSAALTAEGAIVGTMQYMAPEQLEGKPTDARADIFAFGAVMYEMVTGRRTFDADTSAGVIAAILNATPPSPASVRTYTPEPLDRVIMTCLAKAPDDRWQSSADLLRELRWIADRGADAAAPSGIAGRPSRPRALQLATLAACLAAGVLLGIGLMRWRESPVPRVAPMVRLPVTLPPGEVLAIVDPQSAGPSLDLSPDGSKLVYTVMRAGRARLMLRSFDRLEPVELPGTDDASTPFFSPDGEWIGFIAGEKLKKIAVGGGAPLVLATVPPVTRGASWGADGAIYLSPSFSDTILKIPDSGGTFAPVTRLESGEANHLLPQALPGGRAVIFTVWNGGSFRDASLWAWSAATGRRHKLLDSASCGRYTSSGHLVFARDNALLAVPFDLTTLQPRGTPVPVIDDVEIDATNGTAQFALSADGTLVYASRAAAAHDVSLVWVDRTGNEQPIPDLHGDFENARLSPDGRRVALQQLNDIWIRELGTGAMQRITFAGVNQFPVWTPDGSHVAFSRPAADTPVALFWAVTDSSGQAEPIVTGAEVNFPSDWSPNGDLLAFSRIVALGGNWDILTWRRQNGETSLVESSAFNEVQPAFSPDGKWLAYVSDSSGRREVYVRPFPSSGPRVPVSTDGGAEPRWGPDSRELFYIHDRRLMRVAITTTPKLAASKPERLFEGTYQRVSGSPGFASYSVALDGQRFLMIKPADSGAGPTRLAVVLGGFDAWQHRAR